MLTAPEVVPLKLIRTVFQDIDESNPVDATQKLILVLDMEEDIDTSTRDIPDLIEKMQIALPGIFPDEDSPLVHNCGGEKSGVKVHAFRDEVEKGTNIPHLLEHVLLFLMSRCCNSCAAYCGQRSVDLDRGIMTHYYLVLDYPSKLQAVVAVDLAMQLITSWMTGKTVVIEPEEVLDGVRDRLDPLVMPLAPVLPPQILMK